ncbi:MAG: GAF domain-containing protein [Lachnospiraceae bacterium]|nr:GAF domain-containing protein [Lachnospiraceae bacterium]
MNDTDYALISEQIRAFAETDPWYVPFLSNVSALLYENLRDINWAGFYLMRKGRLVLGPFQGKTACIHIEVGKGVCGTAVRDRCVIRVEDVHEFPGHIACDAASASEIVVPLFKADKVIGVLDIDSPHKGRFDEADEEGLKLAARTVQELVSMNG